MKKTVAYMFQILLSICVYIAFFHDTYALMAKNILIFIAWFSCITCFLSMIYANKLPPQKRNIPIWLAIPFDTLIILIIVAHGYFLMGTLWTLTVIFETVMFERMKNTHD